MRSILLGAVLSLPMFGQGGFEGPGRYEIMNLKSGKVLDLDRNDRSTVIQFSSRGADNQTWVAQPAGRGYFFFRNGMNGFALDAGRAGNSEPVRGAPFSGGDSQQWQIQPGKDGNALIVSRFGRTLDIPDGTNRDGARVQVYDLNGDSNQRFTFRRVGGRDYDWDRDRDGGRDRDASQDRDGGRDRDSDRLTLTCSSNRGDRVYCEVETRDRRVEMVRQISGSPCRMGETWGYDRRGIWVDRGCRADFVVSRER